MGGVSVGISGCTACCGLQRREPSSAPTRPAGTSKRAANDAVSGVPCSYFPPSSPRRSTNSDGRAAVAPAIWTCTATVGHVQCGTVVCNTHVGLVRSILHHGLNPAVIPMETYRLATQCARQSERRGRARLHPSRTLETASCARLFPQARPCQPAHAGINASIATYWQDQQVGHPMARR